MKQIKTTLVTKPSLRATIAEMMPGEQILFESKTYSIDTIRFYASTLGKKQHMKFAVHSEGEWIRVNASL